MSRRISKANTRHMKALLRLMKYCVDHPNRGWTLRPDRLWDGINLTHEFDVTGNADSNYATCAETRRSIT